MSSFRVKAELIRPQKMKDTGSPPFVWLFLGGALCARAQPSLLVDNTAVFNVTGDGRVSLGWSDSYSVGNQCYCDSTFDHNIGSVLVSTPLGTMAVQDVCDWIGPGPGKDGRPIYNDIQCGNGPPNDAGDEVTCPGRVDHGPQGCAYIGPKWNFELWSTKFPSERLSESPKPGQPTRAPVSREVASPIEALSSVAVLPERCIWLVSLAASWATNSYG